MNTRPDPLERAVADMDGRIGRDPLSMNDLELIVHAINLNTRALLRLTDAADQSADALAAIADAQIPEEVVDVLAPLQVR